MGWRQNNQENAKLAHQISELSRYMAEMANQALQAARGQDNSNDLGCS